MTAAADLVSFSRADLDELYRYWAGEPPGPGARDEEAFRDAVRRFMGDRSRVMARFNDLPDPSRDLLVRGLEEKGHRIPTRRAQDKTPADGIRALMADPALQHLKKRGFVIEERDRSWPRYHEPSWRIPVGLAELLLSELNGAIRTLETQLSLRSHVRTLSSQVLQSRLQAIGFESKKTPDRGQIADDLSQRDRVLAGIRQIRDESLRTAVK